MATPTTTGTTVPASPAKASGGFPPFDATTYASQLLWLAIAFGLLYYVLNKTLLPAMKSILEDREGRIARDLEEAQKAKAISEAAEVAYQQGLASAKANAQAIAAKTRADVSAEADAARKALEAGLAADLAKAEAEISAAKTAAMANVSAIALDAAPSIVERLTGRAPAPADVASAVDAALRR